MKNASKKRKSVPQITSSAFHRPGFSVTRRQYAHTYAGIDGTGPTFEALEGIYQAGIGSVYITAEQDLSYGKRKPEPYMQLLLTYAGRVYSLYFDEWLSDVAIRARAAKFVRQVELMATAGVKRSEYGAQVLPVAELMPVSWKPADPTLFDEPQISRRQHLDEIDAILKMLQEAADKGEKNLFHALAYAKRANLDLRRHYGLLAEPVTETAAGL
jgi:hypothetical protein